MQAMKLATLAGTLLASSLMPLPATAAPALVVRDINMRTAPGTSYAKIDVIPRGAVVRARYCLASGWCRVRWEGRNGWVSGRYLRTERDSGRVAPPPPFSSPAPIWAR